MQSCIYSGKVFHRRLTPCEHQFSYRLFYLYIDLDELPELFKKFWLWSADRPAIARFKRTDHYGKPQSNLKNSINQLATDKTGRLHNGPVRLLTHLRYWGHNFNPVSFYYCFNQTEQLQTIVCEVNNTPWGEQHLYILDAADQPNAERLDFNAKKVFHVSPFLPLNMDYFWRFNRPGGKLSVLMSNYGNIAEVSRDPTLAQTDQRIFDATLTLHQRPINHINMAMVLLQHPLMTVKVVAAIYYQAMRLWMKKVPFFSHPSKAIKENQT